MTEARKRVIKAQAYEKAYDALENAIESIKQDIVWNQERCEERRKEAEEAGIDFDETYYLEQIKDYTEHIVVYQLVQKEILK